MPIGMLEFALLLVKAQKVLEIYCTQHCVMVNSSWLANSTYAALRTGELHGHRHI